HPGGRPDNPVWGYFTKGARTGKGRYNAIYNFCAKFWNRGEPIKLESHLANHCTKADSSTIRHFLTKILSDNSEKNKSNKKRKSNTYGKLDQYVSIIELDQQKIKRIHHAWARAFAICGISWNIIENPFFIEALKETNLSYKPPTQLRLLIEQMNITGGSLKNYSKTRWTTASETIESVLNLEKVLKK
ncbi:16838_t:CDS:2, partial [Racocetra fulgida]